MLQKNSQLRQFSKMSALQQVLHQSSVMTPEQGPPLNCHFIVVEKVHVFVTVEAVVEAFALENHPEHQINSVELRIV